MIQHGECPSEVLPLSDQGRPKALTQCARRAVIDLRNQGQTVSQITGTLRVNRATVYRELRDAYAVCQQTRMRPASPTVGS